MSGRFYVTNASRRYHIVQNLPKSGLAGGRVLCGRTVRSYGVPSPVESSRYLLESESMCADCRRIYERQVSGRA